MEPKPLRVWAAPQDAQARHSGGGYECLSVHMYSADYIWAYLEPIATQLIGLWNDPKMYGAKTSKLFHSLAIPSTETKPESL